MSDLAIIQPMQKMCEESLSPDQFQAWEKVKHGLFSVRKELKGHCSNCNHNVEPAWHFCPECGNVTKEPIGE